MIVRIQSYKCCERFAPGGGGGESLKTYKRGKVALELAQVMADNDILMFKLMNSVWNVKQVETLPSKFYLTWQASFFLDKANCIIFVAIGNFESTTFVRFGQMGGLEERIPFWPCDCVCRIVGAFCLWVFLEYTNIWIREHLNLLAQAPVIFSCSTVT